VTQENVTAISSLLRKTARAHHDYQEEEFGGQYQEDWPAWYAENLLALGINQHLNQKIGAEKLISMLYALQKEYEQNRPEIHWCDYYAEKIHEGNT
jgi:hypothetical protein